MSFTYDGNLNQPIQYVRFKIGDKDEDVAMFQDEEISYFIDKFGSSPTEKDLNRVALQFLKQMLNEILLGPSRERAGKYEVYGQTAEALKLAIKEIEKQIRANSPAKPYFGGVVKAEVERNREDDTLVESKFYDGRIYGDYGDDPFRKSFLDH